MNLRINKSKIKIKHILGIQQNFEEYPTNEDFLYDLVCVLIEHNKLESTWQINEIWNDLLDIKIKRTFQDFVLELVKDEYVELISDDKKQKFLTFKLIKHPWMF